jgi:hypothetical protein
MHRQAQRFAHALMIAPVSLALWLVAVDSVRSTSFLEVGRSAQPFGQLRGCWPLAVPEVSPEKWCRFSRSAGTSGTFGRVELGRVSTVKQDLDRPDRTRRARTSTNRKPSFLLRC